MGKISKVFYKEIDPNVCSTNEAAKYHYLSNLINLHEIFQDEYLQYEENQIHLRNSLIGDAIKSGEISNPKVYSTIFGISAHKNKAVLITED